MKLCMTGGIAGLNNRNDFPVFFEQRLDEGVSENV